MSRVIGYTKKICRFKGVNKSCGFVNGKTYLLEIADVEEEFLRGQAKYTVIVKARGLSCVYADMDRFLENWEVIG